MFHSKFFKDKAILLLSLILGLLMLLNILSVMLRTNTAQSSTTLRYFTSQGAPEVDKQDPVQLYSFAVFAVLTVAIMLVVSFRMYEVYKPASYAAIGLAMIIILSNMTVSGAILNLQQ